MNYYYIYTGNEYNQILIFDTYSDAFNWCKRATNWSDREIEKNIVKPKKCGKASYGYIIQN